MQVTARERRKQISIEDNQLSNSEALCSLAMLKVRINSGGDYLDYVRPYIIDVLANDPPAKINDVAVAEKLSDSCGLKIPTRTVQVVLQRLAKEGLLVKRDGLFTCNDDFPESDLTAARADANRHISLIVNELIGFSRSTIGRVLSEDEATESLINFLSHFSIPCLKSYLRGTTLPDIGENANWQLALVGHFVEALQVQPNLFDSFTMLMQGHMLANALLCPDLHSVSDSYNEVTFYLDTPLLIQLLGLEGEREEQAIKEVIALVQRLKGKVCYFTHTFDELTYSINTSADFIDSYKGRGTIVMEARKSGMQKADLLMISGRAEEILERSGVLAVATPSYTQENHKFEIAVEAFDAVLSDEIDYNNPRAKDYDIQSVRSVYVLRKDGSPRSLEKAKAVLVTSNTSFSKAAFEYGKSFQMSREVSSVITDFSLANTAWLKAPQGAPALPQKEVLAFAYAAARPPRGFWDKVLIEAEKLEREGKITARDHQLLRSSHHVQIELTRLTLGDEAALTDEKITETIARVSDDIRREALEDKKTVSEKLDEANSRIGTLSEHLENVRKNTYWDCKKQADREATCLSVGVWLSQGAVAALGLFQIDEASLGWVVFAVALLSGVIRMAGAKWDIKPVNLKPRYAEWRFHKLQSKALKKIGLEVKTDPS
ncbi:MULTISPECIES: hypothetical protein [unclassified Pseudomonas]|uniref:hypothetical protein n=1 Tax=unclassified Pseudomonas TaxID=196821 RepID=UPI001A9DC4D9|nr:MULTISPECIES: hypothetical protein [unclassified Pseudomonas]